MLSISRTEANSPDNEGGTGQTGIRNVIEMPPIVPVQYPDGKWGEKVIILRVSRVRIRSSNSNTWISSLATTTFS